MRVVYPHFNIILFIRKTDYLFTIKSNSGTWLNNKSPLGSCILLQYECHSIYVQVVIIADVTPTCGVGSR